MDRNDPSPTDADKEPNFVRSSKDSTEDDLVAYLDGELSIEASAQIEQRLASDPVLRERLVQLQRSWDLLGTIPSHRLDETFTQSTVELVAVRMGQELAREGRWSGWTRLGVAVLAVAAVSISAGVAYRSSRHAMEAPNRQLLNDLPVIERVDLYRNAQDLEFLVRLAEEGLFDGTIEEQP